MAYFYGRASRVVVWLGPSANGSDKAIAMVRKEACTRSTDTSEFGPVLALLQRPWFSRNWVHKLGV